MAAPPEVAIIVFQDELAFVAVRSVDEEVPNANGLAGFQGQDQILPFLHIRLHIAWMIRELNDAHLIKGDDVSDLFQV
ncbi:short-chain dehydrogenase/reductase SDR [Sphingopyxis sp. EG6]|nr:short-chain dehydrogenase/reductase SDR [Sphingopyxis sp. EG6]